MKETPLEIEGINDEIYAGFWRRLASLLLDFVFIIPVGFITLYINSLSKEMFFIMVIPNLIFGIWYHVYLPKKYGGTPGKLIAGIEIIKISGEKIEWKEAILRHSVLLTLTLFSSILMINSLIQADSETYNNLTWFKQAQYLMSLSPVLFMLYTWASNIWVYSEFIVLLTNPRKRAVHDYIAGTVIVKKIYVDDIRNAMRIENES